MDEFVEITQEGLISRLFSSLKTVLIGGFFFLVSFVCLWMNEGNYVQEIKTSKEIKKNLVVGTPRSPNPQHISRPVFMMDYLHSKESLQESFSGLRARWIAIDTDIEMYQWKEMEKTETTKQVGGSKQTKKTYSYEKTWSSSPIRSNRFKVAKNHYNPPMHWEAKKVTVKQTKFGKYDGREILSRASNYESLDYSKYAKSIKNRLIGFARKAGLKNVFIERNLIYFTNSSDPLLAHIGSYRISSRVLKNNQLYSLIASANSTNQLVPYLASTGKSKFILKSGKYSPKALLKSNDNSQANFVWAIRFVGFLLMWLGFSMLFSPLTTLLDIVPFLGDLGRFAIGFVGFTVAMVLSSITIIVAWVVHRPIALIPVVVIVLYGVYSWFRLLQKKKLASQNHDRKGRGGSRFDSHRQAI